MNKTGGGVALYINETLQPNYLPNKSKCIDNCAEIVTVHELLTNKLQNENKEIIIGTDQNFDYLNIHCAYSKHLPRTVNKQTPK